MTLKSPQLAVGAGHSHATLLVAISMFVSITQCSATLEHDYSTAFPDLLTFQSRVGSGYPVNDKDPSRNGVGEGICGGGGSFDTSGFQRSVEYATPVKLTTQLLTEKQVCGTPISRAFFILKSFSKTLRRGCSLLVKKT